MKNNPMIWLVALALSLAFACSSSEGEGGGSDLDRALGGQMSELGDLGDQFVGANEETYDTLAQATELIGDAFAGGLPVPSVVQKQSQCLPPQLEGQTLLVDVQTGVFTPTDPRGPTDAVQFVLLSDPQTEEGYVNITCTGAVPNLSSVNIKVNTTADVEVLDLTATSLNVFPPTGFSAFLSGTLRSADGQAEVPFGTFGFEGNSSLGLSEGFTSATTAFQVAPTITAFVSQNVSSDVSFASEEIYMVVTGPPQFDFEEYVCPSNLRFEGHMQGTPGNVSGGSIFCARPPLFDGFNYFVNCFAGSIFEMGVSQAREECNFGFFGDPPTPISQGLLNQIEAGTNGLFGMHNTVISVAQAGAEVALQLAATAQQ